jgi:RNA polymerase sigma factor FliA
MPRATHTNYDSLAHQMLPLVHKVATQISRRVPPHISYDDLAAAGMLGLAAALTRFDPARADKFQGYAEYRIRGEILDELRRRDTLSRDARLESKRLQQAADDLSSRLGREAHSTEVAARLGISVEQYGHLQQQAACSKTVSTDDLETSLPSDAPDPIEQIFRKQAKASLARGIHQLPEKQRLVLWLYYYEELPLREIAEVLGVTTSRVCQIRSEAVVRLRGTLQDELLAA